MAGERNGFSFTLIFIKRKKNKRKWVLSFILTKYSHLSLVGKNSKQFLLSSWSCVKCFNHHIIRSWLHNKDCNVRNFPAAHAQLIYTLYSLLQNIVTRVADRPNLRMLNNYFVGPWLINLQNSRLILLFLDPKKFAQI